MISVLKGRSRCPQNCHQCPICSSSLLVQRHSVEDVPVATDKRAAAGPYILSCPHCAWTSLEADLIFDYRVNISGQMAEALKQRKAHQVSESGNSHSPFRVTEPSDHFMQLAEFYKAQIEDSNPATPFRSRYARTPGHRDFSGLRRQTKQLPVMREAQTPAEGLHELPNYSRQPQITSSEGTEQTHQDINDHLISQMANLGWSGTTSLAQQTLQTHHVHLAKQLLPTATILHTRRAKRCRTCKHNLLRPADPRSAGSSSSASSTTRYRIRQLASSYIPRLTIRPLALKDPSATTTSSTPTTTGVLKAGKVTHYLLTFYNPLYHTLRITLASPRFTPGPTASKTTILCPSFDVAANKDIWDDVGTASTTSSSRSTGSKSTIALKDATGYQQPEAGKVWASERNATTIVVEIVPGIVERKDGESAVDADVLKVPIFVRLEYDTTTATSGTSATTKTATTRNVSFDTQADHEAVTQVDAMALEEDARIAGLSGADVVDASGTVDDGRRELAYWCVLDFGRLG